MITQAVCSSFKQELLSGTHNFSAAGDTFKIALYSSSATLNSSTSTYSPSNEIVGEGYTAGGGTLVIPADMPSLTGVVGWATFNNFTWAVATITNARGALIYNSTQGNRSVVVIDFGSDKSSSEGDFTIQFPLADSTNAIIRII